MHVAVTSDHDARHQVAENAGHQYQRVDNAQRHCYQGAPVSLSQVHRQVLSGNRVRHTEYNLVMKELDSHGLDIM